MTETPADRVARLRIVAEHYSLEGVEAIREMTADQLAAVYNGIGPESFPPELREAIDDLNPSMEPPALIHDVDFSRGEYADIDGEESRAAFDAANRRLKRNGYKMADGQHPWYSPKRYALRLKARAFARICQRFGWSAWVDGHKAKTSTKETK